MQSRTEDTSTNGSLMAMHMPASWTLQRAAALRATVEQALMGAVPGLRARIELLPWDVEAHFNDPEEPAV